MMYSKLNIIIPIIRHFYRITYQVVIAYSMMVRTIFISYCILSTLLIGAIATGGKGAIMIIHSESHQPKRLIIVLPHIIDIGVADAI